MKYIKTYEAKKEGHEKLDKHIADDIMKTIHSKDMENWSVDMKPPKTGIKNLDTNLGQKVKDLFEEYGMSVTVGQSDFCTKRGGLLPDEENFDEYRVNIMMIQSDDDMLDNYGYDSIEDLLKGEGWTEEEYEKGK